MMIKKRIALIAHDGKKAEMVGFVKDYISILSTMDLKPVVQLDLI